METEDRINRLRERLAELEPLTDHEPSQKQKEAVESLLNWVAASKIDPKLPVVFANAASILNGYKPTSDYANAIARIHDYIENGKRLELYEKVERSRLENFDALTTFCREIVVIERERNAIFRDAAAALWALKTQ